MAPEQALGQGEVDARADAWALGVILYESATGRRPFDGSMQQLVFAITSAPISRLQTIAPELPPTFSGLVDAMLVRDRTRRLSDLQPAISALRELAPAPSAAFAFNAPPARRQRPQLLAGMALLAAAAVFLSIPKPQAALAPGAKPNWTAPPKQAAPVGPASANNPSVLSRIPTDTSARATPRPKAKHAGPSPAGPRDQLRRAPLAPPWL